MWSQTAGHKKQIEQLQKALWGERVPHAFIFFGPEGIGKRQIAVGLAQALLCEKEGCTPCEECPSCQKIAKNIHPDSLLIAPEGKTIRVEVLRDLKRKVFLHPLEGRAKVFILDGAEKMTDSSANALLKILEEPPPQTYFILLTERPSLLLPTIRSRCRLLSFSPLPETLLVQTLIQRGKGEEEAQTLARLSHGSVKHALEIDPDFFQEIGRIVEGWRGGASAAQILKQCEAWSDEEEKIPHLLNALSFFFREAIKQSECPARLETLTEQWLSIERVKNELEGYANKRLLLENLLFTLTA